MELKLLVGNDVGNSDTKMHINGDYHKQATVYSKINKIPNLDDVNVQAVHKNIMENIMVTINSPAVHAGTYYIGKRALVSGLAVYNMDVTERKNTSDVYYINTLGLIAGYAVGQAETLDKKIEVVVDMACSLPVNQYNKQEAKIVRDRFTTDTHNITVHLGNKRVIVDIRFNYIKVLPESVSIMFALKEMSKKNYDDKKILHVAIGEGTTEYPLTTGVTFNPDFILGSNNGIGHAIEKALDPFKQKIGLMNYSRQKYSELLQTQHKYSTIAVDYLQPHLDSESNTILRYVKGEIEKANGECDIVIVHGGGSILMREHLEKKLKEMCKQKEIELFFVNESNAVSLESQGLYAFAQSPIFEQLKNKQ
jgi:plasmid segregation protein ParM